MRSGLAAFILAALAFGAVPAFAAPSPASPPASPNSMTPAAGDNAADDGSGDAGPPAEAPVPDPFLAEVMKTCRDGASGDRGTFQRLQDAGWGLTVDGNTQTPFYQSFSGEKDFDGVGTVDITYSLEVYPTLTEGYCSLSIDTAERKIGIADVMKMTDLKGTLRQTADGIASTWQDKAAAPTTFIQVDQHKTDLYFILDVTTLTPKPAADIPQVTPPATDDGGSGSGSAADVTNAKD